jgi:hypothetical protein
VLSGIPLRIDESSCVAGAAAPESGEFEYSVRPPFALHAPSTTIAATAAPARITRPPRASTRVPM